MRGDTKLSSLPSLQRPIEAIDETPSAIVTFVEGESESDGLLRRPIVSLALVVDDGCFSTSSMTWLRVSFDGPVRALNATI